MSDNVNKHEEALEALKREVETLSYSPALTRAGQFISRIYDPILAEPMKVFGLRVGTAYTDLQSFAESLGQREEDKKLSSLLEPIWTTNPGKFPDTQTMFGTPVCKPEDIEILESVIQSVKSHIEELQQQEEENIPESAYNCLERLEETQLQWENGIAVEDNRIKLLNGLGGSWIYAGTAGAAAGAILPIEYALMTTFAAAAAATTWSVVSFANMPKDALAMAMRVTDKMWSAVNYGFCFSQMYATTAILKFGGTQTIESVSQALSNPSLSSIFQAAGTVSLSAIATIGTPIVLHKVFEGMVQSSLMYDFCDLARSGANIMIEQSAKASMGFSRSNMRMQAILSRLTTAPKPKDP